MPSADGFDIKVADFGLAKRRFLGGTRAVK